MRTTTPFRFNDDFAPARTNSARGFSSGPRPKELYEKGVELATEGKPLDAAECFEAAGYFYKAILLYERFGYFRRARDVAVKAEDFRTADRIAFRYHIEGHEFFDFPNTGSGACNSMAVALASRLGKSATAGKLGFSGFEGKVVADVGTRDGRFVPMFHELGAKEVFGIDPDAWELAIALEQGILDSDHAIAEFVQNLPEERYGTFDVVTVFNACLPMTQYRTFFCALYDILEDGGQIVMTVAEDEILRNLLPESNRFFVTKWVRLWRGCENEDYPHKNLVIGMKKPVALVNSERGGER